MARDSRLLRRRHADLLIARTGGTIGKSYLVSDVSVEAVFASYLIRVIPNDAILPLYLKVFADSPLYWSQLRAASAGTGQPNVNGKALAGLVLPLPPLAEQQRIVAKVDELLALCDELEAQQARRNAVRIDFAAASLARLTVAPTPAETAGEWSRVAQHFDTLFAVPQTIPQLRQTILQLAVTGRLVEQEPGDEPAETLLARVQEERHRAIATRLTKAVEVDPKCAAFGLGVPVPESWEVTTLGQLLSFGPSNGFSPKPASEVTKTKSLTLSATTRGVFDPRHVKYLLDEFPTDSSLWLEEGDILVQRSNSEEYVGVAAIYPGPDHEFVYPDLMMKIRVVDSINPEFVHLVLLAPRSRAYFRHFATGTSGSMRKINQATLCTLPVPIPPAAVQGRIVKRFKEMQSLCDTLESQLTTRQGTAERLTAAMVQAVLDGAGAGA